MANIILDKKKMVDARVWKLVDEPAVEEEGHGLAGQMGKGELVNRGDFLWKCILINEFQLNMNLTFLSDLYCGWIEFEPNMEYSQDISSLPKPEEKVSWRKSVDLNVSKVSWR